jgi:hypothetical protein
LCDLIIQFVQLCNPNKTKANGVKHLQKKIPIQQSMSRLMVLFVCFTCPTAFASECNITFIGSQIQTSTDSMCDYLNYHAVMLVLCGIFTVVFLVMARLMMLLAVEDEDVTCCLTWALSFLVLMLGFEGPIALVYLLLLVVVLRTYVLKIVALCPSNAVGTVVEVESPADIHIFVPDETVECCICLEAGGGPWFTTPCDHRFHLACIHAWPKDTCPLCRGAMFSN